MLVAAAVAAVLVAVSALWVAAGRRDLDPPLMITPALGAAPTDPATAPTVLPSSSPTPSRASPKATRSKAARPSPVASSRRPSARPSPSRTPERAHTARYVGGSERRGVFSAGVVVANEGRTARTWEVRVTYAAADRVRVDRAFGAQVSTSGGTVVFTGGPLAAGDDTMFAFTARTSGDGRISPTSCQVDGRACTISFR